MKRDSAADGSKSALSRRDFLRGVGTGAVTAAALGSRALAGEAAVPKGEPVRAGGVAAPVSFTVNGEKRTLSVEPRTTLVEALRIHAGLTGPKESCDRGTCGACTVLLDGMPVYGCMMLAVEADGRSIVTVEGLARDGLTPVQKAVAEYDGLQCGYCTPGFVMSLTALLRRNPRPSEEEIRKACSGHVCRCGSYPKIFAAALAASRAAISRIGPAGGETSAAMSDLLPDTDDRRNGSAGPFDKLRVVETVRPTLS